jgi:hypothetical protein
MVSPISEFHTIETLQFSPAAENLLRRKLSETTPADREEVRRLFLEDTLADAAVLGEALARAKGHLKAPVCLAAFPLVVDISALEAQLRKVHECVANAALEMSKLSDIVCPE